MGKHVLIATIILCCLLSGCDKKNFYGQPTEKARLMYADSVFYLETNEYTIKPLSRSIGTYTAFPDNLEIDRRTGAITVTQNGTDGESQTGLWYKITYRSPANQVDSAMVLISGITYIDKFYTLTQGDSIIYPIYNGNPANVLPPGNYDLTSDNKFAINPVNGEINIKECMRRGFFGNSSWKNASIKYSIKDNSQQATNRIDLVIYYYRTMGDVPSNVSALMQAHQRLTVGLRSLPVIPTTTGAIDNNLPSNLSLSKPRPPCVIIVGN
ncbi:MAG TPA: hypothetical protein VM871_06800 [Flavisolibacter sp.]|nr:hypothetical protein [Flavisolibacter sp.]